MYVYDTERCVYSDIRFGHLVACDKAEFAAGSG